MSDGLLEKAERYIRSARLLAEDGDLDSAASRLYYAMFYTAERLLEARGLTFSSHRAVISAFGQQFTKSAELDPRFHLALLTGFSQRQLGDYSTASHINSDDIETMMDQAQGFLSAALEWLEHHSGAAAPG